MEENPANLSFEEAFAELQHVLADLRGDAMTLERSIALFARGNALAEHCSALLSGAELRISQSVPQASTSREPADIDIGW
jgi:exodeoxyribonuclease VII small subunit